MWIPEVQELTCSCRTSPSPPGGDNAHRVSWLGLKITSPALVVLLWHQLRQLMVHSDLSTLESHFSGLDSKTGTFKKFTLPFFLCLMTALLKHSPFCPTNNPVLKQTPHKRISTWVSKALFAVRIYQNKGRNERQWGGFARWRGAHLVSPAPTAGPAPAPPAPPAPSASAAGAAQVSKVDLQLGCDVVGGLAEVVIHYRVLSVSLQGGVLHQWENTTKIPFWAPQPLPHLWSSIPCRDLAKLEIP